MRYNGTDFFGNNGNIRTECKEGIFMGYSGEDQEEGPTHNRVMGLTWLCA